MGSVGLGVVIVHGLLRMLAFGWFLIRLLFLVVTLPIAAIIAIFGGRSIGKHISSIMDRKLEQRRIDAQG